METLDGLLIIAHSITQMVAVALLYQAYDSSHKVLCKQLFKSEDDSPLQRLNRIYNVSKHQPANGEDPLWLSNEGLVTSKYTLKFTEFENLAREYAQVAERLTTPESKIQDHDPNQHVGNDFIAPNENIQC